MKKVFIFIITIIVLMALVKTINVVSFQNGYLLYPFFKTIDPDNVFVVLIIHHITQAVISLLVIFIISWIFKVSIREFGFSVNKFRLSIKYVLIFVGIWSLIQAGIGSLLILLLKLPVDIGFPLNFRNFIGRFLFQILLSGTSEEIMFRALVITTMICLWRSFISSEKQLWISVILSSTLIFMVDHINFSISPLGITHFDIFQQLTTLIFGVFYGFLLLKTKSIIGSMIAHNLLNGVIAIIGVIFCFTLG